jgi:hyperosmotically inducible periplasmic protein
MLGLRTAGAFGLGAGVMFLLDPQRGRARRARLRDKAVRTVHEVEDVARGRAMDAAHRAAGALAEARSALRPEKPDDDITHERVRARIGRLVEHPHELETHVRDGVVILTGRVSSGELAALLARLRVVRGVHDIDNQLEVYEGPTRPMGRRQLKRRLLTTFLVGLALALVRARRRY